MHHENPMPIFPVGDDKEMGRKGKVHIHKLVVIFQQYGEQTPWTDFYGYRVDQVSK